jgi:hypothetical protein
MTFPTASQQPAPGMYLSCMLMMPYVSEHQQLAIALSVFVMTSRHTNTKQAAPAILKYIWCGTLNTRVILHPAGSKQ